jgi:hypothetical protein
MFVIKNYMLTRHSYVQPNRVEIVPNGLAGIPDALEKLKQGKISGSKLVALPWETK